MPKAKINSDILQSTVLLPSKFNKKKFIITYTIPANPYALEIQNLGKAQCFGKTPWPKNSKIHAWMLSAETATFMKAGGLGMIASELPEAFNRRYGKGEESITVPRCRTHQNRCKKAYGIQSCFYGHRGKIC